MTERSRPARSWLLAAGLSLLSACGSEPRFPSACSSMRAVIRHLTPRARLSSLPGWLRVRGLLPEPSRGLWRPADLLSAPLGRLGRPQRRQI